MPTITLSPLHSSLLPCLLQAGCPLTSVPFTVPAECVRSGNKAPGGVRPASQLHRQQILVPAQQSEACICQTALELWFKKKKKKTIAEFTSSGSGWVRAERSSAHAAQRAGTWGLHAHLISEVAIMRRGVSLKFCLFF